jgi:hypothetical protein
MLVEINSQFNKMVYTKDEILKWRENKNINPRTGANLEFFDKTYKILSNESHKLTNDEFYLDYELNKFVNNIHYPIYKKI